MSAELSLQQIMASLEARIAFHREGEALCLCPCGADFPDTLLHVSCHWDS